MRCPTFALLLACALGACVDGPPVDDDAVATDSQELSYDTGHDDVDTPAANATVYLPSTGCTGTLVTPTQVLTAAHCVTMTPAPTEPRGVVTGTVSGNRMFVVDDRDKMFTMRVDGDKFRRLWAATPLPTPARADAAAGVDATLYVVAAGTLYEAPEATGAWTARGPAAVTRLAASPDTLWGLDAAGWLVRRARAGADPFVRVSRPSGTIVGLAADVDGRPYVATSDGRLRVLVDGALRDVGAHPGVTVFGNADYLFARDAASRLWMRRAVPWEHEWRDVGVAGSHVLAATSGQIHAFASSGTHYLRDILRRYVPESDLPFRAVALAATASDLFAIDDASRLRARAVSGGAWADLGPTPTGITFRAIASDGTNLYAATSWGILRRPATRASASWTLTQGVHRTDLRALTISSGAIWALTTSNALVSRPLTSGAWTEHADDGVAHLPYLAAHGGNLWAAFGPLSWVERASVAQLQAGTGWFATEPNVDWQSPLRYYRTQDPVWVKLGHDRRAWPSDSECTAGHPRCARAFWYRHSTEADMTVLELDRAIGADVATPVAPMTRVPAGIDLANEWFYVRGWGGTSHPSDARLLRWSGSAWTQTGTQPWPASDLAFGGGGGAMLTIDGDVYRLSLGAWQRVGTYPAAVSVAVLEDGVRILIAEPRAIRRYVPATGTTTTHVTPPLVAGESIRAIAFEGTRLFVATDQRRLLTRDGTTWVTTETNTYPFMSLEADATHLYGLTLSGALVRRPLTGGAWTYLGYGPLADGIAVHAGVIQGVHAGWPRYRQVGYASDLQYPYTWQDSPEDPARFRTYGAAVIPGDSGGSCLWEDDDGRLHLVGVTQGMEAGGGRFTATFSGSSRGQVAAPVPNLAAWLDHVVGMAPLADPVVLAPIDPGVFVPGPAFPWP